MIPPIDHTHLMLATLHRRPFSRSGWIFVLKYDGFRALVRKTSRGVELISRQGNLS
ncbi:hypothetical protein [Caballeronia sp. GaOx3]|uniref:hypothetical protein n=1 Tax=Caballeronia sp. GaOx3 TaxID=2921740 RepID=UPI0020285F5E|nr:hypothetical protein [Caballeronia sp. GaOx3]